MIVQKTCTFTNVIGALGNMESGTVFKTDAEVAYFKNSSQKKFGSGSQAWQQSSASSTELSYTLKNATGTAGIRYYKLDPTHKYYFSIWLMHRTNTTAKLNVYWSSITVLSNRGNTSLSTWTHHSTVFQPSGVTNGSYTLRVAASNYPGKNAAMNIDGLMLIDLTEACGAGNEPSKEWCDTNLAFTTSTITATVAVTVKSITYVGVNNKSRKVKKMYIGVGEKARRVKKAYIGVNNKAKLIYDIDEALAVAEEITNISNDFTTLNLLRTTKLNVYTETEEAGATTGYDESEN